RTQNTRPFLSLRITPQQRRAPRPTSQNLPSPPIDVDGVRIVTPLTRQRIDPPLISLRVVAAKIAATKTGYPHHPIVRHLQPARAMDRRLPFSDLACRRIDYSHSLAVELCVPNLAVRRDVDAVGVNPTGLAHCRDI